MYDDKNCTPLLQLGAVAYKTKCKQNNYNSIVNKQRCRQRNQERRKAKQRMALRFPWPYILVHNHNRIENVPYDSIILLYLTILNNFLLGETHQQTIDYAIAMKSNLIYII